MSLLYLIFDDYSIQKTLLEDDYDDHQKSEHIGYILKKFLLD